MDSILSRFSSSQGRRDQGPNRILATEIAGSRDRKLLRDIIEILKSKPKKAIENDAILTLASLSELAPDMLEEYTSLLLGYLDSKNNRAVWGSMIALSNVTPFVPKRIMEHVPAILSAMDEGTVVTRDHGFVILLHLYQHKAYREIIFALIFEQVANAPDNQLGQYTEKFIEEATGEHLTLIVRVLEARLRDLEKPAHQKRISKILLRLNNLQAKRPT